MPMLENLEKLDYMISTQVMLSTTQLPRLPDITPSQNAAPQLLPELGHQPLVCS